jgi:S1-C subfamily serine protease
MSGPKHLWSGDWQQESAAVSEELAERRAIPADREPPVAPTPPPPARPRGVALARRPGLRHALPVVLAAALLLAAGAYGLTALLGSSGPRASATAGGSFGPPAATAGGPSVSPASTTPSRPSRPVRWLGMQIEPLPPGAAVIETVGPRSAGELAGLEPGDVIVEINNRPIHDAGEIGAAIRGLRAGDLVSLQISRGSTLFSTQATLTAPPSVHP